MVKIEYLNGESLVKNGRATSTAKKAAHVISGLTADIDPIHSSIIPLVTYINGSNAFEYDLIFKNINEVTTK